MLRNLYLIHGVLDVFISHRVGVVLPVPVVQFAITAEHPPLVVTPPRPTDRPAHSRRRESPTDGTQLLQRLFQVRPLTWNPASGTSCPTEGIASQRVVFHIEHAVLDTLVINRLVHACAGCSAWPLIRCATCRTGVWIPVPWRSSSFSLALSSSSRVLFNSSIAVFESRVASSFSLGLNT